MNTTPSQEYGLCTNAFEAAIDWGRKQKEETRGRKTANEKKMALAAYLVRCCVEVVASGESARNLGIYSKWGGVEDEGQEPARRWAV